MENKFKVIENKQVKNDRRKPFLINRKMLEHIENEKLVMTYFEANQEYSRFTFEYNDGIAVWKIPFEIEYVVDMLIVDFNGKELSDETRFVASGVLKDVLCSLRFAHKDKYWSLSHYFIDDMEHYRKRLEKDFVIKLENEWKKIRRNAEIETMDNDDYMFFRSEQINDLNLWITGEDGLVFCEFMKEIGLIKYKKEGKTQCMIELVGDKKGLKKVNEKIIFARDVAKYGYNIWTDYVE